MPLEGKMAASWWGCLCDVCLGVCSSMETMRLEGSTAHHGGDVCVMCVLLANSLMRGSFSFMPEHT